MRFHYIAIQAILAGLTFAQVAILQKAITDIEASLKETDTAIKAFMDAQTGVALLTAQNKTSEVIKTATAAIQGSQPITLQDALQLQGAAQALPQAVQTTIDDLVAKKPVLDQLGVTPQAIQALKDQKTVSQPLGAAIVSKIPAIGQQIAQQNIDQVTAAIDGGITKLGGSPTKRAVEFRG